MRRAFAQFLLGRGLSYPMSFLVLLILLRSVPVEQYGAYVALVAVVEIALVVSDFGIEWVASRFVPAYALHAGRVSLMRLVLRLISARVLCLLVAALVFAMGAGWIAQLVRLPNVAEAIPIAAALLFFEGTGRFVRDVVQQSLMQQGRVQVGQFARAALYFSLVAGTWLASEADLSLRTILTLEATAAAASALFSAWLLVGPLRQWGTPRDAAWVEPAWRHQWSLAWPNYLVTLVTYLLSAEMLILIVTRMVGPEVTALFGATRNIIGQIRRFLPSEFLSGMARPILIGRYEASRDFAELNENASALYKASTFILLPVLAVTVGFAGQWIELLTAGRYTGAHLLATLMIATLFVFSQRRLLEIVVNGVHMPQLWLRSAAAAALVLPLGLTLLSWFPRVEVIALMSLATEVVTTSFIVYGLRREGLLYSTGARRLLAPAAVVLAIGGLSWLLGSGAHSPLWLTSASAAVAALAAAALWRFPVLSPGERGFLYSFVPARWAQRFS